MLFDLTHSLSIPSSYGLKSATGQCQSAASFMCRFNICCSNAEKLSTIARQNSEEFKHTAIIYWFLLFLAHFCFKGNEYKMQFYPVFLENWLAHQVKIPVQQTAVNVLMQYFVFTILCAYATARMALQVIRQHSLPVTLRQNAYTSFSVHLIMSDKKYIFLVK
jgi:hypothetical protein